MKTITLTERQLEMVIQAVEQDTKKSRDGFAQWVSRNVTKADPVRVAEKVNAAKLFLNERYALLDELRNAAGVESIKEDEE